MKTLIEIKNEVAMEFGFYNGYENFVSNMGVSGHRLIVNYFNEVCRRAQLEGETKGFTDGAASRQKEIDELKESLEYILDELEELKK